MKAERKTRPSGVDWRHSFATHITSVSEELNVAPSIENRVFDTQVFPEYIHESLQLPSSQRLNSLNQVSPVAEKVLGFRVSRGEHTEDTMRIAFSFLNQLSVSNPDAFSQLTVDYTKGGALTPDEVIHHCVEYMRLHDAATLAFQGAMHGNVKIDGKGYSEDEALLKAFDNDLNYQMVTNLLFDEPTTAYYKSSGIDREVLKQIASDAVKGTTPLGKMLKKGEDYPPVDWLAYTARDFYELTQIFNIDEKTPFSEKISGVLAGLEGVSTTLEKNIPLNLPQKRGPEKTIEELVPANIVRWEIDNGNPKLVYESVSIAKLYLMHIILRLYFSGSPWIRGTHKIISDSLRSLTLNETGFVEKLLSTSEKELLLEDLTPYISGWGYSPSLTEREPESFVFKDISKTLVNDGERIGPLNSVYQNLEQILINIKKQKHLYLKHHV